MHSSASSHRLLRALGTISFYTLLSRISGFVRDMVIARGFGAGMGTDAFFVALKLPNFLRRLFGEGAFNTAFVPVFSDYETRGEPVETQRMVASVFTMLLTILSLLVAVAQLVMPWFILVVAPGFANHPDKYQLTVELTRVTFPYILFISLVAMAGGVLNTFHRFAVPAATPILLNLSLIGGAWWLAPLFEQPAFGLAWGVFLGGVVQLAVQWPALRRLGVRLRLHWEPHHPAIGRILSLMGPAILGVSVAQIGLLVDLLLASLLPSGSISYLYYADRLMEFPLGIFGVAMGTAILPALSRHASAGDQVALKRDLDFALRVVLVINLPATVGLILLREPILALLFQRGAFDAEATRLTAQALLGFAVGLTAYSTVKVAAPAFYALQDTRTPVRIAIRSLAVNMVLNVALMIPWQHMGLALASSLTAFLNAGLLLQQLHRRGVFQVGAGFAATLAKSALASALMGGGLWWGVEAYWQPNLGTTGQLLTLLPMMAGGLLLYLGTAWLLGLAELRELLAMIRHSRRQP